MKLLNPKKGNRRETRVFAGDGIILCRNRAVGVIAAVAIIAAVIYKCRCNIEKTYKILARIKPNIRLTVQEILDRLRGGGIPFNFEINNAVSISSIGGANNGYRLVGTDVGISIYDWNDRSMKLLATIQGGSIILKEDPVL